MTMHEIEYNRYSKWRESSVYLLSVLVESRRSPFQIPWPTVPVVDKQRQRQKLPVNHPLAKVA